jgi:hypothetical protein
MHPHDWWVTPMDLEGIDSDMKRAVTTGKKKDEPKPFWKGVWNPEYPEPEYAELEVRYMKALTEKFAKTSTSLSYGTWHHIVLFIDGAKEMDDWMREIEVTWIPHERERDPMRAVIIGILLFMFGVIQILIGFGILLVLGETAVSFGMITLGALFGGAGIAAWISGASKLAK